MTGRAARPRCDLMIMFGFVRDCAFRASLGARSATRLPVLWSWAGWGDCQGGWSVTGVAFRYSFMPFVGYLGDLALTSHTAGGNGRPSETAAVALAGRIPPFAARLAQDSAGADAAGWSGLVAPARPDGRRWKGRARGSWRPDER